MDKFRGEGSPERLATGRAQVSWKEEGAALEEISCEPVSRQARPVPQAFATPGPPDIWTTRTWHRTCKLTALQYLAGPPPEHFNREWPYWYRYIVPQGI